MNETILNKVKLALRIVTDAFDDELIDLIDASIIDLQIGGVVTSDADCVDALVLRAIITYCKMHFGEPDEYDRLKASYDEQKAQMQMSTGYTIWGVGNG